MRKLIIGLLVFGLTTQAFTQILDEDPILNAEKLSEVIVTAANNKYLQQVENTEAAAPVKLLQQKVAAFDIRNSKFYRDDIALCKVSFHLPQGHILASYDNGKIFQTTERYRDVALPNSLRKSIGKRFPGWVISKDVYLVDYHQDKGVNKKFKLKLEYGEKVLRIKMDPEGNFL